MKTKKFQHMEINRKNHQLKTINIIKFPESK